MNRKETFRLAIQAEVMSQNLYRSLAKSFSKPEASTIFMQLIPYEVMHEDKMRQLFAAEFPDEILDIDMNLMPEFKHIRIDEPKDVLDFAISREEEAQNIYLKLAEESSDPALKEILLDFAKEESYHKTILFTEIQRLQGMIEWYDPSELNGMVEE